MCVCVHAGQRVVTKPDGLSVQQVLPDLSHGDSRAACRERWAESALFVFFFEVLRQ